MIQLQKITEANFEEVIALDAGDNEMFVEKNLYSIAEAKIIPEYIVEAIYKDITLVGFVMYKFDEDEERMYINRFMIDVRFHRQGLGSDAMSLLNEIASKKFIKVIGLHVHPENTNAISFYKKFGFTDTGRVGGGEKEFELVIK